MQDRRPKTVPDISIADGAPANSSDQAQGESSPRPNTKAIIIGSVIGGIVAIALLLLFLILCRRRTAQRRNAIGEGVFHKDKIIVGRRVSSDGTGAGVRFAQRGENAGRKDLGPDSPSTPLREDFEDRQSATDSHYSADSAAASRAGSGIDSGLPVIGSTPLGTMFGSGRLVESSAPLIPTSGSPTALRSPSRARTDRQMLIEQKILELQGQLITAKGSEQEKTRVRAMLRERIEKVSELRESDWALHEGNTGDDVPEILRG
ncbi:hypothetical protein V5O48_010638 [Marasmius crinis-equi]|uniref:Uncharacterized protein n=1 Tax=Marasmius crinis-equi TaxID=585013 RepID=A0ABR3F836_9AGAR